MRLFSTDGNIAHGEARETSIPVGEQYDAKHLNLKLSNQTLENILENAILIFLMQKIGFFSGFEIIFPSYYIDFIQFYWLLDWINVPKR